MPEVGDGQAATMGGKGIGGVVLVAAGLLAACKSPCDRLLDEYCLIYQENCETLRSDFKHDGASEKRKRECRIQLEELDRFPRPWTRVVFAKSSDRAMWRIQEHPEPRVEGLPSGYAANDWMWQDIFSMVLQSAGEPSLRDVRGDSFRFVWAPSLSGTAFVVRATSADGGMQVEWKHLDRPGETALFRPTKVALSAVRTLNAAESNELTQKIIRARTLPSRIDRHAEDGSDWLLETVVDGGYVMTLRWSPDEESDPVFRDACLRLVSLGTADGGYDGLR